MNGNITVVVDRSEPTWKVTVTNASDEALTYEMMGKVPRGLGVELWEDDAGIRIHAEDLAKYLNVDGFPAGLQKIEPKSSVTFRLNPKSMSATDHTQLEKWQNIEKTGNYVRRVFFGVYASRLMSVSPEN